MRRGASRSPSTRRRRPPPPTRTRSAPVPHKRRLSRGARDAPLAPEAPSDAAAIARRRRPRHRRPPLPRARLDGNARSRAARRGARASTGRRTREAARQYARTRASAGRRRGRAARSSRRLWSGHQRCHRLRAPWLLVSLVFRHARCLRASRDCKHGIQRRLSCRQRAKTLVFGCSQPGLPAANQPRGRSTPFKLSARRVAERGGG